MTKTKQHYGQPVYRVTEDIPDTRLHKGDQMYLNDEHKDRLEVFTKRDEMKFVLDLNGETLELETREAFGRILK